MIYVVLWCHRLHIGVPSATYWGAIGYILGCLDGYRLPLYIVAVSVDSTPPQFVADRC
jgi:hypothetical protein